MNTVLYKVRELEFRRESEHEPYRPVLVRRAYLYIGGLRIYTLGLTTLISIRGSLGHSTLKEEYNKNKGKKKRVYLIHYAT